MYLHLLSKRSYERLDIVNIVVFYENSVTYLRQFYIYRRVHLYVKTVVNAILATSNLK